MEEINELSGQVLDCAFDIHRELGPGLFESVYETILSAELRRLGRMVERQKIVPVVFRGVRFDKSFRVDMIVDGRLIVEVKSRERISSVHTKQLLTYLRLLEIRLGLLLNFGAPLMKDGIHRIIN